MSTVSRLNDRGVIRPPKWLPTNIHYETLMGSIAYGVSGDSSDMDVYGWAIPKKEDIFPSLRGEIPGFGKQTKPFDVWQQHHIADPDRKDRTWDLSIYGVVKFFNLAMDNNPNILDSLFVPDHCVLHITRVGTMVRENRRLFLHKGCKVKFQGYAYSQLKKCDEVESDPDLDNIRNFETAHGIDPATTLEDVRNECDYRNGIHFNEPRNKSLAVLHGFDLGWYLVEFSNRMAASKRFYDRKRYGTDTKFLYHIVRLADEAEQILEHGNIDLTRAREHMKAVRRGEVGVADVRRWFTEKESHLESLCASSTLRATPDEPAIRSLLLNCLEEHYGSLANAIVNPDATRQTLREIKTSIENLEKSIGPI